MSQFPLLKYLHDQRKSADFVADKKEALRRYAKLCDSRLFINEVL